MARPTKPKDLKPKTDSEGAPVPGGAAAAPSGSGFDLKFIIALAVVALISIAGTAGSTYFITMQLADVTKKVASGAHGSEAENPHESTQAIGMNLELDEFMVNLRPDPKLEGTQYLKAKIALSIRVPEAEDCYAKKHAMRFPLPDGAIVGAAAPIEREMLASGGGGGVTCEQLFKDNMGKYVPTILMKCTASTLASLEGQEALKDEIKGQLNQLMGPNYSVLRVNFQDFIIQR
jgi:flagellar basal body-associated protein FliL